MSEEKVTIWIDTDEYYPVFEIHSERWGHGYKASISADDLKEYKKVHSEFMAAQYKLRLIYSRLRDKEESENKTE